jgi:hypothetical protein
MNWVKPKVLEKTGGQKLQELRKSKSALLCGTKMEILRNPWSLDPPLFIIINHVMGDSKW